MAKIVKRCPLQNAGDLNEDRLSGLPDVLLHHIFSFLDVEDVVQTCILSKRWTNFWSSFPFLNLSSKNREQVDFAKFSESLLFHRDGGSNVDTLRVHCRIDVANNVNSWIIFVSKRNVQVLDIQFSRSLVRNVPDKSLTFTHRLYTSVFLRVLKLKLPDYYYKPNLPNRVYLPCLEILFFERIIFDDDCFSGIISSCPKLQSLTLDKCQLSSMVQLSISSPQLRTLILRDFISSILLLDISAPCLTSIYISHSEFSETKLSIRSISDFPYLRNANIYTEFPALASCNKLLTAVRNTQFLDLSEDFLWQFAHLLEDEPRADKWIQCRFDNLKHINLRTQFEKCEVLVIHQLLKVSPNIETFVLSNYSENFEAGATADITSLSECKLYRLKQVKLEDFLGFENEMNLVKFFIKNAENLKKLTLEPRQDCASDYCVLGLAEMTEILLACPRRGRLSLDNSELHNLMARIVKRSQNKDRLSGLPDPLLHHIFSFLETEDVVQTCVLSKKWTDFYSSFPFINLFSKKRKPSDFVKFSDSLLFHRDVGSNVHTLRVCCTVDIFENVNSWIIFVLERNVQVLDIQLKYSLVDDGADKSLAFSHRLYSCVSLKVLKLKSYDCELKLPNHVYLPCLEILYFEMIIFDEDCFRQIISSCPKLHSLTMSRCRLLTDLLSITCHSLQTLILSLFDSPFSSLEIFAPHLITLEIVHWVPLSVRTISDFPYLLNANIHAKFCSLASFNKLWIALRSTQSLNLSSGFLSDFGLVLENKPHADEWIPCPLGNLKLVKLGTTFVKHELLAIYQLLKVSPNLETFKLCNYAKDDGDKPCPADIIVWSELKLNCLKQVHIDDIYANEEMILVKFFLKNAENLEHLRLEEVSPSEFTEELAELTKILLACPRHVRVALDSNSGKGTASLSVTFV